MKHPCRRDLRRRTRLLRELIRLCNGPTMSLARTLYVRVVTRVALP